ncbi:MAG: phosphatase PAP2 family protein [Candidatus Taylorbacteria bacterium]|nr:phosphatase PAP2 family protein [Candidatus Taylorbacteria bacterium]
MQAVYHAFLSYSYAFDVELLSLVQSIGPSWLSVAKFLSHGVGSYPIMVAAFFVALLLIDKWRVALEILVIAAVSFAILLSAKYYFHIERPYVIDSAVIAYDNDDGFALPSGHALMSMVVLGWVAHRHPKSRVLMWGSIALILLVGLSRIYLGVHYPSQVLAGWVFGILILYLFYVIDRRLWSPFQKNLR